MTDPAPPVGSRRKALKRVAAALLLACIAAGLGLVVQASTSIGRLTAGVERQRVEVASFGSATRELQRLGQALLRLEASRDLRAVGRHRDLALQQMHTLGVGDLKDGSVSSGVNDIRAEVVALDWDGLDAALDGGHDAIDSAVAPLDVAVSDLEVRLRRLENGAEHRFYESTALILGMKARSERALTAIIFSTVVLAGGCILAIRRSRGDVLTARNALRATEERFRSLVQNSSDILMVLDGQGAIAYCSPAYGTTMQAPDPVGRQYTDLVPEEERDTVVALLKAVVDEPGGVRRLQHRLAPAERHVESVLHNQLANGAVEGIVVNIRDVSDRQELESRLRRQALQDPLTGLANRTLLDERLVAAFGPGGASPQSFAVLLLDLDGFKRVNDGLGHSIGDDLLVAVGERLQRCTRRTDMVARLGGDEFVILSEALDGPEQGTELAARVVANLATPFRIGAHTITTSASVGVYVATGNEVAGEDVLSYADVAMYNAKREGKGRYAVFEDAMGQRAHAHLELEMDLRAALMAGEIYPHYQPIVDIESGRIVGIEALARWSHPVRGIVPPSEFIPVAEESGLVVEIGQRMLDLALAQLKAWSGYGDFYMSVNVAPRQLRTPGFNAHLTGLLAVHDLDPSRVMLEITEETLLEEQEATVVQLKALSARDVRLAIDDFGTGYSSLAYLKHLPIDVLKIDRNFTQAVGDSPEDAALARAIIHVASSLGLETIAEGIETAEQASSIHAMGCTTAQGFHFARPQSAEDVEPVLVANAQGFSGGRGRRDAPRRVLLPAAASA